jgi:hypothetical protein
VAFEIRDPKLFTSRSILALHVYNLALLLPILASLIVVSLFRLGVVTLLVPLLSIAATAYILPLGTGNALIRRLAKRIPAPPQPKPQSPDKTVKTCVGQLTVYPRLRNGFRAMIDDADDIGTLTIDGDSVRFTGDSVTLVLPFSSISTIHPHNIGIRGRFLYGKPIEFRVKGVPTVERFDFVERQSLVLPASKRISKELATALRTGLQK